MILIWCRSPSQTLPQGEGLREGKSTYADSNLENVLEEDDFGYKTADPLLYRLLKEHARSNRNNQTAAESILWEGLRTKKLEGFRFRRQHIVSRYIADFICLSHQLIIEVDGKIHQLPENVESDAQRTAHLNELGFTVLRFSNYEVTTDLQGVLGTIEDKLKTLSAKDSRREASPMGGGLEGAVTFALLLEQVALISPLLRVRFSTSHPKDITDDVLLTMAKYDNICKYIHLPVQSGNTRILSQMNRTYTREWYLNKVKRIEKSCRIVGSAPM